MAVVHLRQAIVGFYRVLNRPAPAVDRLPLRGLDPALDYRVSIWPASDDVVSRANAVTRRGDDLHANGLLFDVERFEAAGNGDFWSRLFVLEAV